jgi:hypothetical protein
MKKMKTTISLTILFFSISISSLYSQTDINYVKFSNGWAMGSSFSDKNIWIGEGGFSYWVIRELNRQNNVINFEITFDVNEITTGTLDLNEDKFIIKYGEKLMIHEVSDKKKLPGFGEKIGLIALGNGNYLEKTQQNYWLIFDDKGVVFTEYVEESLPGDKALYLRNSST